MKFFFKLKYYGHEVTDFYAKEILRMDSNYTCLVVTGLDSALNNDGNYYLEVFLKECEYIDKEVIRHIIDDSEVLLMILMNNKCFLINTLVGYFLVNLSLKHNYA